MPTSPDAPRPPWAARDGETSDELADFWEFYFLGGHRTTIPEEITRWHTRCGDLIERHDWMARSAEWDIEAQHRMAAAVKHHETMVEAATAAARAARSLRSLHRLTGGVAPERLASAAFAAPAPPDDGPAAVDTKKKSGRKLADPVDRPECGTEEGRTIHSANREKLCSKCRRRRQPVVPDDGPTDDAVPVPEKASKRPSPVPAPPPRIGQASG